jgi:positive regulator of sigma E activity
MDMERSDIESGTVIDIDGRLASVIINKSKSCHECGKAQAGICGKSGAGMIMKAQNTIDAVKGDMVTIELETATQARGFFLFFILPVLALFAGSYAGFLLSESTGVKGLEVITGMAMLIIFSCYSLNKIRKLDKAAIYSIKSILNCSGQ